MNKDFDIESFMSLKDYANEERTQRRKGSKGSQEFFTPYRLVKKMCEKISCEKWSDPKKMFLEPSFGDGQFLVYMIYKRLLNGLKWQEILETTYGVELMPDNVSETHNRIIKLMKLMNIDFDEQEARTIMKKNLVCSDFFRWCFNEWRPLTDEEYYKTEHGKKELKKKKKVRN